MTIEEHRRRHLELHRAFDELFADYIKHHPDQVKFLDMPLRQLLEWSHTQTILPDGHPEAEEHTVLKRDLH